MRYSFIIPVYNRPEAVSYTHLRSDKVFQFSVIPFTDSNVDKATHINKLERTGIINVHLDACLLYTSQA